MTMTSETTTTTTKRTVARISDDAGTAYTAIVETVDPEDEPAVEPAGFHSETTLYTVATAGAVYSDYDPHRLAREKLPGNARWVVDALRDVEERHDREIVGAGPDAEPDAGEIHREAWRHTYAALEAIEDGDVTLAAGPLKAAFEEAIDAEDVTAEEIEQELEESLEEDDGPEKVSEEHLERVDEALEAGGKPFVDEEPTTPLTGQSDGLREEHQAEPGSPEQLEEIEQQLDRIEESLEDQLEAVRSYVDELREDR